MEIKLNIRGLFVRLKPYADLISLAGGAILFFSWVVSNTLQQQYQSAKAYIERAQSEERLYRDLTAIRSAIDSVAAETLNIRQGLNQLHEEIIKRPPSETADQVRWNTASAWISSKRLNADQIEWGNRFCLVNQQISQNLAKGLDFVEQLNSACSEILELGREKERTFEYVEALLGTGRTLDLDTEKKIEQRFLDFSEKTLSRFGPALKRATATTNIIANEANAELKNQRSRADMASGIAFWAYFFGSALVIIGKFLDKFIIPTPSSSNPPPSSR